MWYIHSVRLEMGGEEIDRLSVFKLRKDIIEQTGQR